MSLSETKNRGRSIGSASCKDRDGRGRGCRPGREGRGCGSTDRRGKRNHGKPKEESTFIADTVWAKLPPTIQSMIRDQRKSFTLSKREVSAVNTGRNRVEEDSHYDGDDTKAASEQFGHKAPRSILKKKKPEWLKSLAPSGNRHVNATISTPRRRQIGDNKYLATDLLTSSRAEIDTRTDTICVGKASCVIEYTDQVCDVSPFTSEYEPMRNIPVAKTAIAYDHPYDHEPCILVTAQSLYFGNKLENTLLCPNQMQSHGIERLNTKSSSYPNSPHFQALYSYILTQTFHYITFFSCKSNTKNFF